jgi:hypothetical protein
MISMSVVGDPGKTMPGHEKINGNLQACPPQGMAENRISVSRAQPVGFPGFEQPKNRSFDGAGIQQFRRIPLARFGLTARSHSEYLSAMPCSRGL